MAFPVVEGTAETAVATAGTSHAITLPASISASDLVLITMDIGSTSATMNALTDWTEILDESAANGLKIWWYTGAGVPGNPTFTSSASTRSASIAWRISGANKSITPEIGTTATGTSVSPDPPIVTPTGGSKNYLFIAFAGMAGEEADDDTWGNTPPTSYTPSPPLQKSCGTAGTNFGGLILAASRGLTASSDNPGTFNVDVSAAWRAQTVAIHPAPPTDSYGLTVYNETGLVGYWRVGESAGTTLASMYGPYGTYNASGVTYSVTALTQNTGGDTAVSFLRPSGTSGGYATIAQAAAEAAFDTAQYTFETWVTPLSDTARSSAQNLLDRTNYGLYLTADNKPSIFYGAAGASTSVAASALVAGTNYHLAYTFDGTTHVVYVNGGSVISVVGTRDTGGALGIANYPGGFDTANVTMDEVAVYNTALSGTTVLAHYTAGAPAAAATNHFLSLSGVGS